MATATLVRSDLTFTVDAEAFAAAAAITAKSAGTFPGTAGVNLAFKNQAVVMSATDFETSVTIKLPVKGKRAKAVAVPAKLLAVVAAKLVGQVTITIDDRAVELVDDTGLVYEVPVSNDTPPMPLTADDGTPEPFDFLAFVQAVAFTAPAASVDQARPILAAIRFDGERAIATDSFRLHVTETAPKIDALIPAYAAVLASKAFPIDADVTATFSANRQRLVLASANVTFGVRLTDGTFPNWEQLIPSGELPHSVMLDRKALHAAISKVAVTDKKTVPVRMSIKKDRLQLVTIVQDVVKADADISANGTMPNLAVNGSYAMAALKVMPDELVALGATDGLKPMLFTDGTTASPWKVLLMPVRIP